MQSKAATVDGYLTELPEDRREAIEAIRKVILKNLPKGYEEGMLYLEGRRRWLAARQRGDA